MNTKLKFVFSMGLFGLLCLLLPASLRADTTYTYTGNTFTACTDLFVSGSGCQGSVNIFFETSLTGSALDNLSDDDITNSLVLATITDGEEAYTGPIGCGPVCNNGINFVTVHISTNAVGDITAWSIVGDNTNQGGNVEAHITSTNFEDTGAVTVNTYALCGTISCASTASVRKAGTWSAPVGTPEPSPATLMLIGVVLAIALRKRIRQTRPQAA